MLRDEKSLARAAVSAANRHADDAPIRERMFAIDLLGSIASYPALGQAARDAEAYLARLAGSGREGWATPDPTQRVRAADAYDAVVALTHANPVSAAKMIVGATDLEAGPYVTAVIAGLLDIGMSKSEARA